MKQGSDKSGYKHKSESRKKKENKVREIYFARAKSSTANDRVVVLPKIIQCTEKTR